MAPRIIEILLVEDNHADARLTIEALKETKILANVNRVKDGMEAMEYLQRKPGYEHTVRPDLILLDLNMPRKSGREVLEEIKDDSELNDIPVVVLTTSSAEEDIVKCYKLRANCYIQKPVDLDEFTKVVRAIDDFWFTVVKLPTRASDASSAH